MATYSAPLQPPLLFRFDYPDEWAKWRRFRITSGLSKEDEKHQVSTLLYCLREDADNVLTSTNISDENKKKYTEVLCVQKRDP